MAVYGNTQLVRADQDLLRMFSSGSEPVLLRNKDIDLQVVTSHVTESELVTRTGHIRCVSPRAISARPRPSPTCFERPLVLIVVAR